MQFTCVRENNSRITSDKYFRDQEYQLLLKDEAKVIIRSLLDSDLKRKKAVNSK